MFTQLKMQMKKKNGFLHWRMPFPVKTSIMFVVLNNYFLDYRYLFIWQTSSVTTSSIYVSFNFMSVGCIKQIVCVCIH